MAPVIEDFGSQMCQPALLDKLKVFEPALLSVAELCLGECQEDKPVEQGDVSRRHLLPGNDNTAVNGCSLAPFVVVDIDFGSSRAVPYTLEELSLLKVNVILVLIQMDDSI